MSNRPTPLSDAAQPGGQPEDLETPDAGSRRRRWWARKLIWIPVASFAALGLLYAGDLLLSGDGLPRNTTVGGVAVGGLMPADAAALLDDELGTAVSGPRDIRAGEVRARLNAGAAGIALDVDATVEAAGGQPYNPLTRLLSLFGDREVDPTLRIDDDLLDAAIADLAVQTDRAPVEGTITFDGVRPVAVEPVSGLALDQAGAAGVLLDAVREDPRARANSAVELPVEVVPVNTTADDVQEALDAIAGPALAAPILVTAPDGTVAEIPVTAIAAALRFIPDPEGALQASIDPGTLLATVGDGFAAFTTESQDARFEIVGGAMTVVDSVDGSTVDGPALAENMLSVLTLPAPRQVPAPLTGAPAAFTTDDANALGITEVVSSFTTNYTSQASGENIRVVAAEVDAAVVLPGDSFSLNGYTGPRTEAEGYIPAGVIIGGEFQQAIGGGVSQFATTTFNAIFFAGLEDVYHKPHSYYISRYPAGREATVFYDSIDLVFRNDQPTGIYIQTIWSPGSLTVTFWGTKQVDIESVSSERRNFRSPVTREKPDDGSCSASGGSTGFDITVTRVFKALGTAEVQRSEEFVTRYNAEPRIVCVPIAPPPEPPPPPEPTPPATPSALVFSSAAATRRSRACRVHERGREVRALR